mmetsp:Transcript_78296/g.221394  ORF Transcript_78296/g.221394 Transcript_78296/m.221394 type:complete len:267 (+) Transcript_78296:125-925(+)
MDFWYIVRTSSHTSACSSFLVLTSWRAWHDPRISSCSARICDFCRLNLIWGGSRERAFLPRTCAPALALRLTGFLSAGVASRVPTGLVMSLLKAPSRVSSLESLPVWANGSPVLLGCELPSKPCCVPALPTVPLLRCSAELESHRVSSLHIAPSRCLGLHSAGGELPPDLWMGGSASLRHSDGDDAEAWRDGVCRGKSPRRASGDSEPFFPRETSWGCKAAVSIATAGEGRMGGRWPLFWLPAGMLLLQGFWTLLAGAPVECTCTP